MNGIRTAWPTIFGKRFYTYLYYLYIITMLIFHLLKAFSEVYLEPYKHLGWSPFLNIVNSIYLLTVFAESFSLDVCTGSECVLGYFVSTETINLLIQWWQDKS